MESVQCLRRNLEKAGSGLAVALGPPQEARLSFALSLCFGIAGIKLKLWKTDREQGFHMTKQPGYSEALQWLGQSHRYQGIGWEGTRGQIAGRERCVSWPIVFLNRSQVPNSPSNQQITTVLLFHAPDVMRLCLLSNSRS